MTEGQIKSLADTIKLIDTLLGGQVILYHNENAQANCVVCLKDKEVYDKVASVLGLDTNS